MATAIFSLFYVQDFNHTEGWGKAIYHGTFSSSKSAREAAVKLMASQIKERVDEIMSLAPTDEIRISELAELATGVTIPTTNNWDAWDWPIDGPHAGGSFIIRGNVLDALDTEGRALL